MEGVYFKERDGYALCCVENFSDELRKSIKENLSRICHGAQQASRGREMYKYNTTIKTFWERYNSKPALTKKGMLGELLSHVILLNLFPRFEVVSPFFNLEERNIKKGFDLLLYESSSQGVWITEVKSGELHKGKDQSATTADLLSTARDDLKLRLAEQQLNHWQNAIHAARVAIDSKSDYKDIVIEILESEGDLVACGSPSSQDNNAFLVSTLFSEISQRVLESTLSAFSEDLKNKGIFKSFFALSIHKGTLNKIESFLKAEAGC